MQNFKKKKSFMKKSLSQPKWYRVNFLDFKKKNIWKILIKNHWPDLNKI